MPQSKKTKSLEGQLTLRSFSSRHIGLEETAKVEMLNILGYSDFESFIKDIIPKDILDYSPLQLETEISTSPALILYGPLAEGTPDDGQD